MPGSSTVSTPPLSLYVHMPWCVAKCPYCDFNSHALRGSLPEADYLVALLADLDAELARNASREIVSVFFGGGTPSLFSPDSIGRVIESIGSRLKNTAEVTMEANPGTVEHGSFLGYRDAGINRVSLGAQSFDDAQLKQLGRIHAADDIRTAVDELARAGLDNFNLDLMYGLPRQSVSLALADIDKAIELAPAHISHYQLTIEPNTLFAVQPPVLPDEDTCWEMQLGGQERLAESGYTQYEVSAYALDGRQCAHNLNYWTFGDYMGVGAGAHGKVTDASMGRISRYSKLRHPRAYIGATETARWIELRRDLADDDRILEFMLNALRLNAGFRPPEFEQRTGLNMAQLWPRLEKLRLRGLLDTNVGHVRASRKGRQFLNDLVMEFVPNDAGDGVQKTTPANGYSHISA